MKASELHDLRPGASPREAEPPRLVEDAPALADPGWLPPEGSGWDALDELGGQHRRLLSRRSEVVAKRRELREGFEAEDAARHEAQTAAFLSDDPEPLPEVTPEEDRRAALSAVSDQVRAANAALDEFVRGAVAVIEEHAGEWGADLAARRADAADKRAEAARLLEAARAEEVAAARAEQWVKRNGGVHERRSFRNIPRVRFVTWASQEQYLPPEEPEDDGMGGVRPQLVAVPSSPPWDAEASARREQADREAYERERAEHPERFVPESAPAVNWSAFTRA